MPHATPTHSPSSGVRTDTECTRSTRARPPSLPKALALLIAVMLSSNAHAILPVTDVGAILQLITQVHTMEEQLLTARDQLTQAQSALTAMTGSRGMQNLLTHTTRNYLPTDYQQLIDVMHSASASYSNLSHQIQAIRNANAILSDAQLSRLTPVQRLLVEDARREAATLDALTRGALNTTSGRFAAIQQLIATIGTARDQKAILDLQARIQAEQGMLQNESTKLDVLYHTATASQQERQQRIREQAIADVGSLRSLPPMGLTLHP